MILLLILQTLFSLPIGVRNVTATSCEVIPIRLSPGITTQIVLEQTPTLTLHANQKHFLIKSDPEAPRSVAVIPTIDSATVDALFPEASARQGGGVSFVPSQKQLMQRLDERLRTNLFIFFKRSTQLMFELQFVEKSKADYIVHVRQRFSPECKL